MQAPIYFINLATDTERRKRIESELARLNLEGHRLEAVWWKQLPEAQQSRLYSETLNRTQYHSPLVAGEKGCYASHLAAWQQLLASDAPAMVVLEDDVRLGDDFPKALQAIEELTFPWDMVKLIGRDAEKIRSAHQTRQGVTLIEYQRVPSMTAGYVVSRSGARKLLASRQPFGRPVDIDLRFWWENDLLILGVTPSVLTLDDTSFTSSIGQKAGRRGLLPQWKKFAVKMRMSYLNAVHQLRRGKVFP